MTAPAMNAHSGGAIAAGIRADRQFKYLIILPAVFILLFIGIFPLIYTLVASVQNITMMEEDTSFHGLIHYRYLFEDTRLWKSIGHTLAGGRREHLVAHQIVIDLVQPTGTRLYGAFALAGTEVLAELQAHDVERPGETIEVMFDMQRAIPVDPESERVL